jgi:hypothetical protein
LKYLFQSHSVGSNVSIRDIIGVVGDLEF